MSYITSRKVALGVEIKDSHQKMVDINKKINKLIKKAESFDNNNILNKEYINLIREIGELQEKELEMIKEQDDRWVLYKKII